MSSPRFRVIKWRSGCQEQCIGRLSGWPGGCWASKDWKRVCANLVGTHTSTTSIINLEGTKAKMSNSVSQLWPEEGGTLVTTSLFQTVRMLGGQERTGMKFLEHHYFQRETALHWEAHTSGVGSSQQTWMCSLCCGTLGKKTFLFKCIALRIRMPPSALLPRHLAKIKR